MDHQNTQKARDSLSRCTKDPDFLDRFYELFVEESPEIKQKFENTKFEVQKRVLSDSLFLMLTAAGASSGKARAELEKLAKRHSRDQLAIKPEWYTLWLECLMQVVAEKDPDYSDAVDAAWRASMQDGIEFLKAGY